MRYFLFIIGIILYGCSAVPISEFHGKKCDDEYCTTYNSGYNWAKKNKIDDEKDCRFSSSEQFIYGCEIWKNEQENILSTLNKSNNSDANVDMNNGQMNSENTQYVTIKYRDTGPVNIVAEYFEPIKNTDTTVKNAWYSATHEYLVITLGTTNYQYCRLPESVWFSLSNTGEPYGIYTDSIRGRYDCREGGLPEF